MNKVYPGNPDHLYGLRVYWRARDGAKNGVTPNVTEEGVTDETNLRSRVQSTMKESLQINVCW